MELPHSDNWHMERPAQTDAPASPDRLEVQCVGGRRGPSSHPCEKATSWGMVRSTRAKPSGYILWPRLSFDGLVAQDLGIHAEFTTVSSPSGVCAHVCRSPVAPTQLQLRWLAIAHVPHVLPNLRIAAMLNGDQGI